MEQDQTNKMGNKNTLILITVVIIAIVVLAAGFVLMNRKQTPATTAEQTSTNTTESTITPSSASSTYKDGQYSAEGSYQTHANTEKIGVTLTLTKGIITAVDVKQEAVLPMSKQMQADFAANYKPMVIGKNIDEVNLGKVSGSSLTPNGFNAAIEDIKSQAKS